MINLSVNPRKQEIFRAAIFLIVLLGIFFYKPIFLKYSLDARDALYNWEPWKSYKPEALTLKTYLKDPIRQFYPWMEFSVEMIRKGNLPLWNPYNSCGIPLIANYQSAVFYPLNILFYLLPFSRAFVLSAVIRLFFAGFFMYLFLKMIEVKHFGAILAAVSFTFCGFLVLYITNPATNVAVCLPLLFFLTEKLVQKKSFLYSMLLGIAIGIQFLGGHIETSFHIISAAFIYLLFRIFIKYRGNKKAAVSLVIFFVLALFIGLLLAFLQILPSIEYFLQSVKFFNRNSYVNNPFFLQIKSIVMFLLPNAFGSPLPIHHHYNWLLTGSYNDYNAGYVGFMPLLLALFAIILRRKDKTVLFFLGLSFISLAVTFRIQPFFWLVTHIPGFRQTINTRLLLIHAFSICILAGIGGNILAGKIAENPKIVRNLCRVILWFGITVICLAAFFYFGKQIVFKIGKILYGSGAHGHSFKENLPDIEILYSFILRELTIFSVLFATGVTLIIFRLKNKINIKAFKTGTVAISVISLFIFGMNFNPSVKEKGNPRIEPIEFIKNDKGIFRISSSGLILQPNTGMPYKIFDIRDFDAVELLRYLEYLKLFEKFDESHILPITDSRLMDLLNVKYVLSEKYIENEKFKLVFDKNIKIYENKGFFPRAFIVGEAKVIKDKNQVIQELKSEEFDPRRYVILEETAGKASSGPADFDAATISRYSPNEVIVNAELSNPGYLVLSDTYYPGWKAWDNDQPAKILRANYIMRSVYLDKGKHEVRFLYKPKSFRVGLWITLTTLLFLILYFCFILFAKIRLQRQIKQNKKHR